MVIMSKKYVSEIIEQAEGAAPKEACGILAGKNGKVEKVYQMINKSDTPETCYFMDPGEQLKVMKEIRNIGWEMLGIYHTHPASEAYPSARDVELAYYPEVSHLIVSLNDRAELRAFRISEGKIEPEEIGYEDR
jgi:proteasome lid subunit RPN8/RPN11